jgi:hypothetical protein
MKLLRDFSTEALTAAIKANLFEYYEYLGRSPGAELQEGPHLKWLLTGIPHPFLNNVLRTQLTEDNAAQVIHQTLAFFPIPEYHGAIMVGRARRPTGESGGASARSGADVHRGRAGHGC